jgi:hypothetical protein
LNKPRTLALIAGAALLAGLAGSASAASGGAPASAVPPGCSFSRGVTTCTTTTTTTGTPTVVKTPGTFRSTTGPAYDLEYAANAAGDCTPGAPTLEGGSITTVPAGATTTTTAHRGAPGSNGEALPTTVSSSPGQPTVTTVAQPASPGTVTVTGVTATAVFTGLKPSTSYAIGVRCDPGNATSFTTDSSGKGTAVLALNRYAGQLVQLELFLAPADYFGPDYAVTAPLTVATIPQPQRYEAETLLATGTFVDGFGYVQPDSRASGAGYGVFRMSPGSTFTASISVPLTGTYDLASGDARYPDTAVYTLAVDGSTVGSPTDSVGTGTLDRTDHGTVFLTAGVHQLTQTVVGTNNPYGYTVAPDYYELTLVG